MVGPRPQTQRCFEVFPEELQETICSIRPGLSGLGPIVFRDEENILTEKNESVNFYDLVIAPYKGKVEAYYTTIYGTLSYFKIIFATLWVVIFPRSFIVWKIFPKLPIPPEELKAPLNYPTNLINETKC